MVAKQQQPSTRKPREGGTRRRLPATGRVLRSTRIRRSRSEQSFSSLRNMPSPLDTATLNRGPIMNPPLQNKGTCPICFKTIAQFDKAASPLQDFCLSPRQVLRLRGRNPYVHNHCWTNKAINPETVVDRTILIFPLESDSQPSKQRVTGR